VVAVSPGVLLAAVGCLAAGGWLWWHREAPKTTTGLFLAAGAVFGTVAAHAITASPAAGLILGVAGVAALAAGGWWWWLDGGHPADIPAVVALLAGGGIAVCLAAALLTAHLTGAWAGLTRLVLAAAVLVLAAEVVVKGMWKGRARPRRWHPVLAVVLPTLAIAVGVPVLAPLMTGLGGGLGALGTAALTTPTSGTAHTGGHTHTYVHLIGANR
jgi:hypothetical protein